jgi:thiol:disulfide interchange protein DsbD
LLVLAGSALGAQGHRSFDPELDVKVALVKGSVVVTFPEGAHLKAAFMEVALKPGTPGTLKVGPLPPTTAKDELGDGIWHDRVAIPLAGEGLPKTVDLVVTYQPCTEGVGGICFQPADRTLTVDAAAIPPIKKKAEPPMLKPPAMAAAAPAPSIPSGPASATAQGSSLAATAPASPAAAPAPGSVLWLFLAAFGFGLLASLTPCVYPMIPITMAIIGAKGGGKGRGFALSLMLVLGMAVTYTTLGVLAARTGAAFGAFAQAPGFLIPVSIIFAIFAFSLLGAFEIGLPEALQSRLQGGSRKGFAGAFLMGLVLGPLSAPCVGPFIGTVLVAIAKDGRVFLGGAELFTFALGMGVLFLAVGTFSASLPRSGTWMVRLKQFMGLVILGFAVWNVRLVLPEWLLFSLWSITLFLVAPLAGAFETAEGLASGFLKSLGLLALALGVLLGVRALETGLRLDLLPRGGAPSAPAPDAQLGDWMEQDLEGALAKANGRLVLVDTYAEWCAECKELDETTWQDPQITAWIREHAVAVRIDTFKTRKDLGTRFSIQGYPTVLLLDGNGKELRRSIGFLKPKDMLAFLKG